MKKRILSLILCLVMTASMLPLAVFAENTVLPEIRITGDVTSVTEGQLPAYTVSSSTAHVKLEAYGANTKWARKPTPTSDWEGFGSAVPTAVNNGQTSYALRICILVDSGYAFDQTTKIYYNGTQVAKDPKEIGPFSWGGYVYIDLGMARESSVVFHTVSFNTDCNDKIEPYLIEDGATIYAPSVSKRGFTFVGWYLDSSFKTPFDFEKDTVKSDITLYAKWSEDTVIPTIILTGSTTSVEPGVLPSFEVSSSTDHIKIDAFGANTKWARKPTPTSGWEGFGWDVPTAVNDGQATYAMCLCIYADSGYAINNGTEVYYNGTQVAKSMRDIGQFSWGAYVYIDLGYAIERTGDGWYLDDDGCLHLTGKVTNDSNIFVDETPWKASKDKIKTVVAETGSSVTNGVFLFSDCPNLETVNLSKLNTTGMEETYEMFARCKKLTSVNLTGINTSSVISMVRMFYNCTSLTALDLSGFNTANLKNMAFAFAGCSSLGALNISNFDVSKVTEINDVFSGCYSLTEIATNKSVLSKTAAQMMVLSSEWKNKANTTVYKTEAALKAISGKVTLEKILTKGDINGDGNINAIDANLMKRILAGNLTPTAKQENAADLNGDGNINAIDASRLLMMLIG